SQTFSWTVAPLALANPGDRSDAEGATVSVQLDVTGASSAVTYSASGLPPGVSLGTTTGLLSGSVGLSAHGNSPHHVTAPAPQGNDSASQPFTWPVPPRVALVNPGSQSSAVGDSVEVQVHASDLAAGTLSYSADGLPYGLYIDPDTGLIAGTISYGTASD